MYIVYGVFGVWCVCVCACVVCIVCVCVCVACMTYGMCGAYNAYGV